MVLILAKEEGFNPFRVSDLSLIFWVLIAFVVVLYLLAKRVFPRLQETLADRERQVKEDLEGAEQTRQEAERLLEDYKARIAQTREEASRVGDEIRETAQKAAQELIKRTEAEARLLFDKTQKELLAEKDRTVGELHKEVARWAAEIAGRILDKELSAEAHSELVDSFIREVAQMDRD